MHENEIGSEVVAAAIKIHQDLGPGLLESVYEIVLAKALQRKGLRVARQVAIPLQYDNLHFEEAFRADLIVHDKLILEIKSVESLNKVHHKQLFTYLRLKEYRLGYLLNFGAALMKDGIKRIVNGLDTEPGSRP